MRAPIALLALLTVAGCAVTNEEAAAPTPANEGETAQAIHPQRPGLASAYSEAVLVQVNNAMGDYCSGVLVAPRVILTAAHCVVYNPVGAGLRGTWTIKAPFTATGLQTQTTAKGDGEPMDVGFYSLPYGSYDSSSAYHDLALIYLTTPFTGVNYPDLVDTTYPVGSVVAAIGRDSVSINANLVMSGTTTLLGTASPYLFDDRTGPITDPGDSGGPLFLEGTHTLVGTETRYSASAPLLDWWMKLSGSVYSFISNRVASHGGWAIDFFRNDVSSALCSRVQSCCAAATPGYTITQNKCTAIYDKLGFDATARGIQGASKDRVSVDGATKTACLAQIAATSADCSMSSAEMKAAISDCLTALTGRVALGGACSSSTECAGNAVCETNAGGTATCQALRTAGQSCEIVYKTGTDVYQRDNLAQDLCSKRGGGASGLYCDAFDFGTGAHRAEGTWTCKTAVANGQPCNTDSYCASSVCAPYGTPNQFTCVAAASFVSPALCTAFD